MYPRMLLDVVAMLDSIALSTYFVPKERNTTIGRTCRVTFFKLPWNVCRRGKVTFTLNRRYFDLPRKTIVSQLRGSNYVNYERSVRVIASNESARGRLQKRFTNKLFSSYELRRVVGIMRVSKSFVAEGSN